MGLLLLVEDDPAIRSALVRGLSERGHSVRSVGTALEGLREVVDVVPDLVLLDLGLPDLDGREALRMLRAVSRVPVIVATARDDEAEMVRLLDIGADDYVVKPFSAAQLDARVRAVLRRATSTSGSPELRVGELRVDPRARTASLQGRTLSLSRKEFDLLRLLVERAGEVVTRRELLAEVWQQPYGGADKTLDVHVSWLRRKLGESASEPQYLQTVRGVGVKLVDPTA